MYCTLVSESIDWVDRFSYTYHHHWCYEQLRRWSWSNIISTRLSKKTSRFTSDDDSAKHSPI